MSQARKLILEELPSHLNAEVAKDVNAVIQLRLGKKENYIVTIKDQTCTTAEGLHSRPDVTLMMDATDYANMVLGNVSKMEGRIKIAGNLALAIQLNNLFK